MVKINLFLICLVLCGCMTIPQPIVIGNNGVSMKVHVRDSGLVMKDSTMFTFILTNPNSDTVMLDKGWRLYLAHNDSNFVFHDTYERILYTIYEGDADTIILPKDALILNVIVCLKPELFYYRNNLYACLSCADYYDKAQKEIVHVKHKISVYSSPFYMIIH